MKKLEKKNKELLYVMEEPSIGCDFCGEPHNTVFTSEYVAESRCSCKSEMQICVDCVDQLSSFYN